MAVLSAVFTILILTIFHYKLTTLSLCVAVELLPWEVDEKHHSSKCDLCINLRYYYQGFNAIVCYSEVAVLKWQWDTLVVDINL